MDINDFFEGAEKRISFETSKNLLDVSDEEWKIILTKIGCTVLSTIQNDEYKFFLLSESSCLISKTHVMIKTCGKTKPLLILDNIDDYPKHLTYSHCDFMIPDQQPHPHKTKDEEIKFLLTHNKIEKEIKCYNFDKWMLCISDKISSPFHEFISRNFEWNHDVSHTNIENIVKKYFPESAIDPKCFEPYGYSMNMLNKNVYITIHVTPQKSCCYFSLETNMDNPHGIFKDVLEEIRAKQYEMHISDVDGDKIKMTFSNYVEGIS